MKARESHPTAEEFAEVFEQLTDWGKFQVGCFCVWLMILHAIEHPSWGNVRTALESIGGFTKVFVWPHVWRAALWIVFALLAGLTLTQIAKSL